MTIIGVNNRGRVVEVVKLDRVGRIRGGAKDERQLVGDGGTAAARGRRTKEGVVLRDCRVRGGRVRLTDEVHILVQQVLVRAQRIHNRHRIDGQEVAWTGQVLVVGGRQPSDVPAKRGELDRVENPLFRLLDERVNLGGRGNTRPIGQVGRWELVFCIALNCRNKFVVRDLNHPFQSVLSSNSAFLLHCVRHRSS